MKRPCVLLYKFYLSVKGQLKFHTINKTFYDHRRINNYCLYSYLNLKNHHLTCPNYLFNLKLPMRLQAEALKSSRVSAGLYGINMQIRKRGSFPHPPLWVSAQLGKVDGTFVQRKRNYILQAEAALCQGAAAYGSVGRISVPICRVTLCSALSAQLCTAV